MIEQTRVWTNDASLSEMNFARDWDYFASIVSTLRQYLFEYGTVPQWNFLLCGGKPELSNPQSWAFLWPSLFAYLFPPYWALMALWAVLTAVGFWATKELLLRWTTSAIGAWSGATLYAFSGYFASHFNQGHLTWAFFHIVPLLMLLHERAVEHGAQQRPRVRLLAGIMAASFCFFTAALPHPLFYFYPAFLLFAALWIFHHWRTQGGAAAFRASAPALAAHGLGLVMSAYKLWPVIAWQGSYPRQGVMRERLAGSDLFMSLQRFVPDFGRVEQVFRGQFWGYWEYAAFIGPVPLILSALTGLFLLVSRFTQPAAKRKSVSPKSKRAGKAAAAPTREIVSLPSPLKPVALLLAPLLLVFGFSLSLGNDHPLSLIHYLEVLPLIEGIRVFARYQILIIFGLAVLSAAGIAVAGRLVPGRYVRAVQLSLGAAVAFPVLAQSAVLIWAITGMTDDQLRSHYNLTDDRPDLPDLYTQDEAVWNKQMITHQRFFTERGHWLGNCYEPMSRSGVFLLPTLRTSITSPAPEKILYLGSSSVTLGYAPTVAGDVKVNLSPYPFVTADVPHRRAEHEQLAFEGALVAGKSVTISARPPYVAEGVGVSALGAGVSLFFLGWMSRRRRMEGSHHDSAA